MALNPFFDALFQGGKFRGIIPALMNMDNIAREKEAKNAFFNAVQQNAMGGGMNPIGGPVDPIAAQAAQASMGMSPQMATVGAGSMPQMPPTGADMSAVAQVAPGEAPRGQSGQGMGGARAILEAFASDPSLISNLPDEVFKNATTLVQLFQQQDAAGDPTKPNWKNMLFPDGTKRLVNLNDPTAAADAAAQGAVMLGDIGQEALPYTDARFDQELALRAAGASRTSTNVNLPPMETEEGKAVGKGFGEIYVDMQKSALKTDATLGELDYLNELLTSIETGKFKGTTNQLKKAAEAVGMNLEALGITDDTAAVDAAIAIQNKLALELRDPSQGAGMPGPMSNQDLQFLLASTPGIENSQEAIPLMIEIRKRIVQRNKELARVAREYREKTGVADEGMFNAIDQYNAQNPLFDEAFRKKIQDAIARPKTATRPGADANNAALGRFSGLSEEQLNAVDVGTLSAEELIQLRDAYKALGNGGQ